MRNLDEIRKDIDKVDKEILRLLIERLGYSEEVANYKKLNDLPILNAKREKEILDNIEKNGGKYGLPVKQIFGTIMELSRALQHDLLQSGDFLRAELTRGIENKLKIDENTKIACQGIKGANSHAACDRLFPTSQIVFCSEFEDVFKAVEAGQAQFGLLPIENSSAGSVTDVFDLILKYRFYIAAASEEKINHCLASVKGTDITNIKTVVSHPQALLQCRDYIKRHGFKTVKSTNTAVAAQNAANEKSSEAGVICSKKAAEEYSLDILDENIQDSKTNCTRFILISKKLFIPESAEKISLCFGLPHVTGSLYSVLARFSARGLNLTKIESRPDKAIETEDCTSQGLEKTDNFEYLFYLDFAGNIRKKEVMNLLCALSVELPKFSFLGNYEEYT